MRHYFDCARQMNRYGTRLGRCLSTKGSHNNQSSSVPDFRETTSNVLVLPRRDAMTSAYSKTKYLPPEDARVQASPAHLRADEHVAGQD